MKIVLVGYMGSGKSSIGKKLAEVLKVPFKDMDSEIENAEATSIAKIFSEKGEIHFRKVENRILKDLLQRPDSFVLATGGGTPCYADSMDAVLDAKDVISIYLKTPLDTLVSRLFPERKKRPLLAHLKCEEELKDFVRKHLFERSHFYNKANRVVDSGADEVDGIVEKIILGLF